MEKLIIWVSNHVTGMETETSVWRSALEIAREVETYVEVPGTTEVALVVVAASLKNVIG